MILVPHLCFQMTKGGREINLTYSNVELLHQDPNNIYHYSIFFYLFIFLMPLQSYPDNTIIVPIL